MTATQRAATFVERQVATQYRKLLRTMKDVDLTTAPPDVQQAMLALHQTALMVWMEDRSNVGRQMTRKRGKCDAGIS